MDYPEVVTKLVYLRTVRKKLGVRSKYKRYKNFFKDLLRIWENAKKYHKRGSRLSKHAEFLERLTMKLIAKFKKEVGMRLHSDEGSGSDG